MRVRRLKRAARRVVRVTKYGRHVHGSGLNPEDA